MRSQYVFCWWLTRFCFVADGDQEQEEEVVDALTPREIEVLEQVVAGATNKEIAEILVITENTVKIRLHNVRDVRFPN